MKNIGFLGIGVLFGIIMTKSEAISWFRIYEMFRFESFHMYGIIGTAVAIGIVMMAIMKATKMKTLADTYVGYFNPMKLSPKRHLIAGSIFGLGWAITGCCPGPMYVLLGNGYGIAGLIMLGAILGTYTYGVFQDKLPH